MSDVKNKNSEVKVLSLFSGCGGMDMGFEGDFDVLKKSVNESIHSDWLANSNGNSWVRLPKTNFKTVFANDILPAAKASWLPYFTRGGRNGVTFRSESIIDLVKNHYEGKEKVFPNADVIIGGFPCQDFSVAGKRNGFNSRKAHHGGLIISKEEPTEYNRGKLYMWMRNVVDIVKPKVFIAENVKGLVSLADAKSIIENDFRSIGGGGYIVVDARVLRAQDYGVSQTRERVVFVGFRKDALTKEALKELIKPDIKESFNPYPQQTHGNNKADKNLLPYVRLKDVFVGLKEPELTNDPAQKFYSKAKWYGKHCQGQSEINLAGLGPTIRAEHHGNIEFRRLAKEHGGKIDSELEVGLKERRLTIRECARIQTFPDEYEFIRNSSKRGKEFALSGSDAYRVIGNAVPPLLAFHIAWRLQELWPKLFKKG